MRRSRPLLGALALAMLLAARAIPDRTMLAAADAATANVPCPLHAHAASLCAWLGR